MLREKQSMIDRLRPLPCYIRLLKGELTVEDCLAIDQALGRKSARTKLREAWLTVEVQSCRVFVKEWQDGGAKWLGEMLLRSPKEVFRAHRVYKILKLSSEL